MPDTDFTHWRLVDLSSLRWAQWEENTSLFNGDTGETHLLSEFPVYILSCLSEGPSSLDALCERTAQACDANNDAAWREKVHRVLIDLGSLDLVEPQPTQAGKAGTKNLLEASA